MTPVIGHYGGYRKTLSFGLTCLVYHATTTFCRRNYNYQNDALVAFRLSELPDTNGQTVDLKVKWNSFSGPKSTTFKYCTRKETNSISSVISQPSLATIPRVDGIY